MYLYYKLGLKYLRSNSFKMVVVIFVNLICAITHNNYMLHYTKTEYNSGEQIP